MLGVENSSRVYFCPSCKDRHSAYPFERLKVVVSDSTLHQFYAPPGNIVSEYEGDLLHSDYVTISGAYIEDLYHAFRLDYEVTGQRRPLDVVMVAGYNDLVRGHSREFMMDGYRQFTKVAMDIGSQAHPGVCNTVAISTLMFPPPTSSLVLRQWA